jgi:hypothetical protein
LTAFVARLLIEQWRQLVLCVSVGGTPFSDDVEGTEIFVKASLSFVKVKNDSSFAIHSRLVEISKSRSISLIGIWNINCCQNLVEIVSSSRQNAFAPNRAIVV